MLSSLNIIKKINLIQNPIIKSEGRKLILVWSALYQFVWCICGWMNEWIDRWIILVLQISTVFGRRKRKSKAKKGWVRLYAPCPPFVRSSSPPSTSTLHSYIKTILISNNQTNIENGTGINQTKHPFNTHCEELLIYLRLFVLIRDVTICNLHFLIETYTWFMYV